MSKEKRLADVNELLKEINRTVDIMERRGEKLSIRDVIMCVKNAPTVDAVEVVRCEKCGHCEFCYPEKQIDKEATPAWYCSMYKRYRKPNDFCSRGERKDNEMR